MGNAGSAGCDKNGGMRGIKFSGGRTPGGMTALRVAAMLRRKGLYSCECSPGIAWAGWMSAIFGGGLGIESNISLLCLLLGGDRSFLVESQPMILSIENEVLFLLHTVSVMTVFVVGLVSVRGSSSAGEGAAGLDDRSVPDRSWLSVPRNNGVKLMDGK